MKYQIISINQIWVDGLRPPHIQGMGFTTIRRDGGMTVYFRTSLPKLRAIMRWSMDREKRRVLNRRKLAV